MHKKSIGGIVSNNKGAGLATVIVMLFVVMVFVAIITDLFFSNIGMAHYQEDSMEVYYLAYSGVQMAFTALIADDNELFDGIKDGDIAELTESDIIFENGTIDLYVTKSTEADYLGWIKIISTGKLNLNDVEQTRTVYIDPLDQKNVVWK